MSDYPLLIQPDALEARLHDPDLLVVDLSKAETYAAGHIPGAVHLDYGRIVVSRPPVGGLLPSAEAFGAVLSALGVTARTHVVACDDEGGGRAARLLWTLEAYGHRRYSLLDGGLLAWAREGHPLSTEAPQPAPSDYRPGYEGGPVADREYILARLGDPRLRLLDTRTPGEYRGTDRRAARGGHIPGAVNLNWTDCMDPQRHLRLRPRAELEGLLAERGIAPGHEVITYCQTHHRSAHTWFVLRHLGYEDAKGYPGAWSDWGNRTDTPVET